MAYKTSGGAKKSLCKFYELSSDHSTTTLRLTVEAVISTNPTGTGVTITTIKSDNEIKTFINDHASAIAAGGSGSEAESLKLDDGTSVTFGGSGSASSSAHFLVVSVGGENTDGVLAGAYIGTLTEDTGSHTREADKHDQHTLGLSGINAKTDVTVSTASGLLDNTVFGAGATMTLAEGKWKTEKFLAGA